MIGRLLFFVRAFWHSVTHKTRSDWQFILGCVLLACLIWVLKTLGKPYTYPVRFVLSIDYSNKKLIAYEPLPTQIRVKVRGSGWKLIKQILLADARPLRFVADKPGYLIDQQALSDAIQASSPYLRLSQSGVVVPLFLPLSKRASRRLVLAVRPGRMAMQPGYGIYGIPQVSPSRVVYSGLDSILAALPDTQWLSLPGSSPLSEGLFDKIIPICEGNSNEMSCRPTHARLQMQVVAYIGMQALKKPVLKNWPNKRKPKTTLITVNYQIAQPDINLIREKKIMVLADYSQKNQSGRVPLRIINLPKNAVLVEVKPAFLQSRR